MLYLESGGEGVFWKEGGAGASNLAAGSRPFATHNVMWKEINIMAWKPILTGWFAQKTKIVMVCMGKKLLVHKTM